MNLKFIIEQATNKKSFLTIHDYINFCDQYLSFKESGLQAEIISQNENHYRFYQYKQDGSYNITRPINSKLMYEPEEFLANAKIFLEMLDQLRHNQKPDVLLRPVLVRCIYTIQQSIGAALDALPAGKSNQARKINGDLFEHFIRILINYLNVDCVAGTVQVAVKDDHGTILFPTSYQHDLLMSKDSELKVIGSVKTSSKDRIDKVFMDKFLYSKMTNTALPHVAIFLNDVQRKNTKQTNKYGVNATFLPGHFKAYTIKLNPLDGVYYCDIRPNMIDDTFLAKYIYTIDRFFCDDLWVLLNKSGQNLEEIYVKQVNELADD